MLSAHAKSSRAIWVICSNACAVRRMANDHAVWLIDADGRGCFAVADTGVGIAGDICRG